MFTEQGIVPVPLTRHEDGSLQEPGFDESYDPKLLHDEIDRRSFARDLARWHFMSPVIHAGSEQEPGGTSKEILKLDRSGRKIDQEVEVIWSVMRDWAERIPEDAWMGIDIKSEMQREVEWAFGRLGSSKQGLVEHKLAETPCILWAGNKVVQNLKEHGEKAEVHFFDYECGVACHPAFIIALYFGNWSGFDCDYTMTPSPTTRWRFVEEYVNSSKFMTRKLVGTAKEYTYSIETLNGLVDEYRGLPGLWFGLWGLVLAHESSEGFDYRRYAKLRLSEYYVWKGVEPVLGFGEGNADVRIREDRWFGRSL